MFSNYEASRMHNGKKKPTMLVITKGQKNVNSSEVIDLDKGKVK